MSAKKTEAAPSEPEKIDPLQAMRRHTDELRAGEQEEVREQAEFEADLRRRYVEVISRLDNPQPHDADVLIEAASAFGITPEQVGRDALIIRQAREQLALHTRKRELSEAHNIVIAWSNQIERREREEQSALVRQVAVAYDGFRHAYEAQQRLEELAAVSPGLFDTEGFPRPLGDAIPAATVEEPVTATREEIKAAIADCDNERDTLLERHRAEQFAVFTKRWKLERLLEKLPELAPVVSDEADDQGAGEFDDLLDGELAEGELGVADAA